MQEELADLQTLGLYEYRRNGGGGDEPTYCGRNYEKLLLLQLEMLYCKWTKRTCFIS